MANNSVITSPANKTSCSSLSLLLLFFSISRETCCLCSGLESLGEPRVLVVIDQDLLKSSLGEQLSFSFWHVCECSPVLLSAPQSSSVLPTGMPKDRKVSTQLVCCGRDWVAWPQVLHSMPVVPFPVQSGT